MQRHSIKTVVMTVLVLTFVWVGVEAVCYILVCGQVIRPDVDLLGHGIYDATDRPYTRFDPLTGYRYIPGETRLVITNDKQLTVDHVVRVNRQGYCSVNDFSPHATDGAKRYVVFGDSYTAGEVSDTTWPDLVNIMLNEYPADSALLFMNFALEAVGLSTWHRQYFHEVLPSYDFDGIVLAVYGGDGRNACDLCRKLVVKHSDDHETRIGFFHNLPTDSLALVNAWGRMLRTSSIYDVQTLEHFRDRALGRPVQWRFQWAALKPYFTQAVITAVIRLRNFMHFKRIFSQTEPVSIADSSANVLSYMGADNLMMLTSMLDTCRERNTDVIIVAVPSFEQMMQHPKDGTVDVCHLLLRYIARQHGAFYIDGSAAFDTVPYNALNRYTLKGDMHWNRQGAELFALYFAQEMRNRSKCRVDLSNP